MRIVPHLLLIVSGCSLVSCSKQTPPRSAGYSAPVVAAVAGRQITLADFEAEMQRRAAGRSGAFAGAAEREALLQELIKRESVFARAQAEGFDQTPALRRQMQDLVVDHYLEQHLRTTSAPAVATDGEIQRFYEQHREQFVVPEQVCFAVIEIGCSPKATKEKQDELRQKAESILGLAQNEAGAGAFFGQLALRYSEDQATRYIGGDAGWVSKGQPTRWDPAVSKAAFALGEPGELSPVVRTENALYLVQLIERKAAGRRPINEVKAAISYQLEVARREQTEQRFFEQLRSGQVIEINRTALESLEPKLSQEKTSPPRTPAS